MHARQHAYIHLHISIHTTSKIWYCIHEMNRYYHHHHHCVYYQDSISITNLSNLSIHLSMYITSVQQVDRHINKSTYHTIFFSYIFIFPILRAAEYSTHGSILSSLSARMPCMSVYVCSAHVVPIQYDSSQLSLPVLNCTSNQWGRGVW
jgi:hypothetical protein